MFLKILNQLAMLKLEDFILPSLQLMVYTTELKFKEKQEKINTKLFMWTLETQKLFLKKIWENFHSN